jgi:hypothetical protein
MLYGLTDKGTKGHELTLKNTLETSGEDVKTTLETSGEDVKTTLISSVFFQTINPM